MNEFGYFSKTVADQLGIKSDTLRSWARVLERHGIEFDKNEKQQRIYSDKDVRAFAEMKELLRDKHPLFKVGKHVAEKMERGEFDEVLEANHASIMFQSREENLEEFKTEIISGVLEGLKGEFASLLQQPQKMDMLPPPEQTEMLQSILYSVQKLQERPTEVLDSLGEEKYQELLKEHNRVIQGYNNAVDAVNKVLAEKQQMQNEIDLLNAELDKWRNKPFWKTKP